MSCNITIPLQRIIDDVRDALASGFVRVDNPTLNDPVLNRVTLRGEITADTDARISLCGLLQACEITADELEWLSRPAGAGLVPYTAEAGGVTTTAWTSLLSLLNQFDVARGYNTKKAYPSYADMVEDANNLVVGAVEVYNDEDPDLNGTYYYDGTTFTRTLYDPVAIAKAYVDTGLAAKVNKVSTFGSPTVDVLYRLGTNYESRAVTPETASWTPQYDGWNNGIVEKIEARTWYHDFRPTIADGSEFNTDGCNFFMGPGAGNFTMRPNKAAIGDYKLHTSHNYGIGLQALGKLTTGYKNTTLGTNTGRALTEGFYNTAVGRDALHNCTIGHSNTMTGMTCGYGIVTGNYNSNYGTQAGYNNLTGSGNVQMGGRCGFDMTEGDNNVFLGYQAAIGQLSGTRNISVGYQSANNGITSGSYNTILGGFITGLDNVSYQVVLADGNGGITLHNNPSGTKRAKLDIIGRDTTVIDMAALDSQESAGTTFRLFNTSNGNSFAQMLMQSRTGQAITRLVAWGSQNPKLSFVHNKIESLRIEADSSVQLKTGTVATAALATAGMMGFELVDNTTLKIKVKGTDNIVRSVTLTLA